MPAVSIVLPSFNREALLREAVDSVFAQTFADWELIIADDGSAAPTREYLASLSDPRVRVAWREHCGNPATVRNAAIAMARAPLVAFLDSDDWWLPGKLAAQVATMQASPERQWSYTRVRVVGLNGQPHVNPTMRPWHPHQGWIAEALLRIDALVATPTVMVTRKLLDTVGGFDASQEFAEDYDLWVRLGLASQVSALEEPLACVRVHPDHYSADRRAVYRDWTRLYRKFARTLQQPRLRALCRDLAAANQLRFAVQCWSRRARGVALANATASMLYGVWRREWWRTAADLLGNSRHRAAD